MCIRDSSCVLTDRDFSFYQDGWQLLDDCSVLVGASSRDIRLKAMVRIPSGVQPPYYPAASDGHWDAVTFYSLFDKIPQISFSLHPFTINATPVSYTHLTQLRFRAAPLISRETHFIRLSR